MILLCLIGGLGGLLRAAPTVSELNTRFRGINIPEGTAIAEVSSRVALDAALGSMSAAQVFVLKAGEGNAWSGATLTLAPSHTLWLVGDPTSPAEFAHGITLSSGNVRLANLTLRGAQSASSARCPGVYITGGSHILSGLIITECAGGSMDYACGLAAFGGATTVYDTYIINNTSTSVSTLASAVFGKAANLTLVDCVIAGNTKNGTTVYASGGVSTEACTLAATLNQDPQFVALLSGTQQVYFGWAEAFGMKNPRIERETADGWETLSEGLTFTPGAEDFSDAIEQSLAPTVEGWNSARYEGQAPGTTARYRLTFTSTLTQSEVSTEGITVTTTPLTDIPQLHSRENAALRIYLDFSGYVLDGRGDVSNARIALENTALNYVQTAPFVYTGGDETTREQMPTAEAIRRIWAMVAEDFAPFDVDVTTVAPPLSDLYKDGPSDTRYGVRAVIGYTTDADGNLVTWFPYGGGVSVWGSFNASWDLPVFVFSISSCQNIAAQVTHEVGHTLGLHHDGGRPVFGGTLLNETEYYTGHELTLSGTLNTGSYYETNLRWFPIMGGAPTSTSIGGIAYDDYDVLNQWSCGDYAGGKSDASSIRADGTEEDDLAILLGLWVGETYRTGLNYKDYGLRLLPDDAGDTIATALPLTFSGINATHEGLIGKHLTPDGKGVEEDVDTFTFVQAASGPATLRVVPNYQGNTRGASLNAKLELFDSTGTQIASADRPIDEEAQYSSAIRNAELAFDTLDAGCYTVRVSGTVLPLILPDASDGDQPWHINDATNYGSLGPYTLTVTREVLPTLTPNAHAKLDTFLAQHAIALRELNGFAGETPLDTATLNAALELFEGDGLLTEVNGAVTLAYDFAVTAITFGSDGDCLVTVCATDASGAPLDVVSGATFSLVSPKGETLATLPRSALTPATNGSFTLTLPKAQTETARLFSVRITPPQN